MHKASGLTHEPVPDTRKFAPGVHGARLGGEDQEDASSKGSKEPCATTRLPQIIVIPDLMVLPVPKVSSTSKTVDIVSAVKASSVVIVPKAFRGLCLQSWLLICPGFPSCSHRSLAGGAYASQL